ncbi:Cof-type HAD-IIB family hydrolase [Cronobacter dublinensis]|uniref:Cof-type HAD-IIB family hydrolase n=1 Tax=Cronobacter dublinensis TaxID=413497 RepID=UPI001375F05A|nr:Cof-type HAD-IIB family hydrolase [Cronobacter dublinensis]EKY3087463.1 HAD family hydrolase [Cronobacter dublinensis]ELQ6227303.1 HAD family hydrolase [Cronobacter dublinensis]ELY4004432.1 HAD family hydrolase [Cronobacter dublinensis]ELY4410398.1 HAD family hydrolase [Cronobacter dublinensis]ELY5818729.1 HAD family hydrolase [Cronobacter dublinensis]
MAVKLIAVDMDGTFLSDAKTYNRARFLAQYAELKARGIRFVVASGNQYYQLTSFFPEIADEIAFVAENGAWVVCEGDDLFNGELTEEEYRHVITHLLTLEDVEIIACGKRSGYTLNRYDARFKEMASHYYHRLEFVDDLFAVKDIFFKFALNLPDSQLLKTMDDLTEAFDGIVVPVSSGHGSIDLIIPGLHKANGIQMLQRRWGIADHEVVAFGDGGNDVEMLRHAGFGFAMENAPQAIHEVARYRAPANNQEGVLEVIDKILNGEAPFA